MLMAFRLLAKALERLVSEYLKTLRQTKMGWFGRGLVACRWRRVPYGMYRIIDDREECREVLPDLLVTWFMVLRKLQSWSWD